MEMVRKYTEWHEMGGQVAFWIARFWHIRTSLSSTLFPARRLHGTYIEKIPVYEKSNRHPTSEQKQKQSSLGEGNLPFFEHYFRRSNAEAVR